jgi:nucleotide-binding universal stress UspA family protein
MSDTSRIMFTLTESAPMIVATDGREQSDAAIRAGALLAGRSDAWFVLTVVSPLPITAPELDLRIAAEAVAVHRETQVQAVHDQVRWILGEREVRVEALDGNPADVIARTAAKTNASLIVAGLGRHKIIDRVLGDETVLRLIRSAETPVLAIDGAFAIPKTVVVGLDFSENSVNAARFALRLVQHGATVYLMNVAPRDDLLGMVTGGPAVYHERAMATMNDLISKLEVPPGVHVQPVVRLGDPGTRILEYAAETHAELIAVGTRGQGFVARMLAGSVATKIIRASPIAVLTLPQ